MSFIFTQKFSTGKILVLLLVVSASLLGCKKGYDEYWNKENPKTGFIYDKLKNDPNFSIFAQGLERAGLVKFVNISGLYTVFAPTNEAFEKFFKANGYTTIQDVPTTSLFAILSYHIANNMWYYYDFRTRFTASQKTIYITRNNKFLNVDVSTANVFTVNNVPVSTTLRDIDAENGVIHGIGEVLIPLPNVEEILSKDPQLSTSTFYKLMQVLSSREYDRFNSFDVDKDGKIDSVFYKVYPLLQNVSTSIEYVVNTAPESQGGDPVFTTLLIPSNAVMDAMLAPVLPSFENDIKKLPRLYIEALLESYFIKDRKILSSELIARPTELKSINEEVVPALTSDKFVQRDIAASNGMIHVLNTSFPPSDRQKSAIGVISSYPEFTDFIEALQGTSLLSAYAATAKAATFLIPTNEAFAAAGLDTRKKTLNGVTLTVAQLTNIIKQHVISANLTRTALTGSKTTDYASNPVVFTTTNNIISAKGTGANTAIVGEEYRGATGTTNGYIFKIDKVLIPATY